MSTFDWKRELERHDHRVVLSGQPITIHCHHYNINLQRTLEETLGGEGVRLIYRAAEEAIFHDLKAMLVTYREIRTIKSKMEMAAIMYQNCGLGVIHSLDINTDGGHLISSSSHHVTGWLAKHGRRPTPGCHFSRGWIAGALEAICDKTIGHYKVMETQCKMMCAEECIFHVEVR